MKLYTAIATAAALAGVVSAHPGEEHLPRTPVEFEAHALRARKASNCASHVSNLKARRLAKRSSGILAKRNVPTSALSAATAQATGLLNTTCLTTPEATEGPYFLKNSLVRSDIAETQGGIPLTLDIGLIDINTCEPLSNNLVEIWSANATGSYSFFSTASLGGGGGGGMGGGMGGGNDTTGGGGGMSGSMGSPPSGSAPASGAAASSTAASARVKRSDTDTDDDGTFLRGGYPTNDEGIVEFTTIYPGYYTGRTAHIHMAVRKDYEIADNGTVVAGAGTVEHIGQLFFDETLNNRIFNTSTYSASTQSRTYNDDDSILQQDLSAGDWPLVDAQLVGDTLEEGIYAYITIGIDTNASTSLTTTNYLTSINEQVQASAFAANGLLEYLSSTATSITATSAQKTASGAVNAASTSAGGVGASSGARRRFAPFRW